MATWDVIRDPGPEADLDIVAVHGLNPFNKEEHAYRTWTKDDKLWLRDFLPNKLPNARVILFGYDANFVFGRSTGGINDKAELLLMGLTHERQDDPHRPLIFISHSLGGILVKRAIIEAVSAHNKPEYDAIRNATYGLVFFGTPHRGSGLSTIGHFAAKIMKAVLHAPDDRISDAFKDQYNSVFTRELQRHFRHRLEDFFVISFYEDKPMLGNTLVVSRESAVLELPASREEAILLPLNHSELCKFSSETDSQYRVFVESPIVRMCRNAVAVRELQKEVEALSLDMPGADAFQVDMRLSKLDIQSARNSVDQLHAIKARETGEREKAAARTQGKKMEENAIRLQNCLKSLEPPGLHINFVYADVVTGDFARSRFFHMNEFQSWQSSPLCDVLYLKGNAGSGKSVLMRRAVQYFREGGKKLGDQLALSFFFDSRRSTTNPNWNTATTMYRSLLYQLLNEEFSPLPDLVESLEKTRSSKDHPWKRSDLEVLLETALRKCLSSNKRIYIFLDALDEWDFNDLTNSAGLLFLQNLIRHKGLRYKLCVSSRPCLSTYFTTPFNGCTVNIETFIRFDIGDFLKEKTETSAFLNDQKRRLIISELSDRAESNFMWVVLVHATILESANIKTESEIREVIRGIPKKLLELYQRIMDKLPKREEPWGEETLLLFQLVVAARRALSLGEVIDAISISLYQENWKEHSRSFISEAEYDTRIVSLSGGLIQVTKGEDDESASSATVHFTHETVRHFLVDRQGLKTLDGTNDEPINHRAFLQVCFRCLDYFTLGVLPQSNLDKYALSFWMDHTRLCDHLLRKTPIEIPSFLRQCSHETKQILEWYTKYLGRRVFEGIAKDFPSLYLEKRLLVLLASEGCTHLMMMHYRSCSKCYEEPQPGVVNDALYEAINRNAEKTVECLVNGMDCNLRVLKGRSTALYHACYMGLDGMVKVLLGLGADIYQQCKQSYRTPLNAAVGTKRNLVIDILLKHPGADVATLLRGLDRSGGTAIHIAARHKDSLAVAVVLLRAAKQSGELDVLSIRNNDGKTPYEVAMQNNNRDLARKIEEFKDDD